MINNSSNLGKYRDQINSLETNLNNTSTTLTNKINTTIANELTPIKNRLKTVETEVQPIARGGTGNTEGISVRSKYHGNHTETASNGDAGSPFTGMLYSSGLYVTGTYQDPNTPCPYGNIINIAGNGSNQLLLEWKGTDTQTGSLYYRSHRDTSTGAWGSWNRIVSLVSSYNSGTSWYRFYDDGWIEQGGYFNCSSHGTTVTFHKAFSNTNYYLNGNATQVSNGVRFASFYNRSTTGAACYTGDDSSFNQGYVYWYACGY
jgi:hypothetical protein